MFVWFHYCLPIWLWIDSGKMDERLIAKSGLLPVGSLLIFYRTATSSDLAFSLTREHESWKRVARCFE